MKQRPQETPGHYKTTPPDQPHQPNQTTKKPTPTPSLTKNQPRANPTHLTNPNSYQSRPTKTKLQKTHIHTDTAKLQNNKPNQKSQQSRHSAVSRMLFFFGFVQALPHLECIGPSFDPLWTQLRQLSVAHREASSGFVVRWSCSKRASRLRGPVITGTERIKKKGVSMMFDILKRCGGSFFWLGFHSAPVM